MPTPHETIERFFPAMFADDRETLAGLVTDDIEWHAPPFAAKGFGELRGRERILDFLCGAGDAYYQPGSFSLEKDVQAVEGDRAVVIAQLHARTARGRPYSNRYAFGFRFREGRICEAWELLDSVHFQKQQAAE
ncbi:MAG: nuclear transport factor 2 family protein [Spirochaetaceae bacterium]|nr:nuclear transport factor 2 family protein [Myxococcales bacterium]MCB9723102.1 nuclear transport factor 2 family protein [Spirochaetaceae bacterium]HPG26801.1 nuclear transport factor 2 family protein [Myxococcota bacterium]